VPAAEYKIAEVLVFSQNDAALGARSHYDFRIACRRRYLCKIDDLMPTSAKV
jgi:hypothetical protein